MTPKRKHEWSMGVIFVTLFRKGLLIKIKKNYKNNIGHIWRVLKSVLL